MTHKLITQAIANRAGTACISRFTDECDPFTFARGTHRKQRTNVLFATGNKTIRGNIDFARQFLGDELIRAAVR
jgi:hypothetical protein